MIETIVTFRYMVSAKKQEKWKAMSQPLQKELVLQIEIALKSANRKGILKDLPLKDYWSRAFK